VTEPPEVGHEAVLDAFEADGELLADAGELVQLLSPNGL